MHVYQVFLYFIQSGASPLMIGSQCGMLEVVRTLLRFHARVDVFDEVSVSINVFLFKFTIHHKSCSSSEPFQYTRILLIQLICMVIKIYDI